MKRVALFGGAFDPPHIGHIVGIRQILDTKQFNEVWVVPSGLRRDKQPAASPEARLAMIQLLVENAFDAKEPVRVQSYLVENPETYPLTVQEIEFLRARHPDIAFTVAIGPDQARVLDSWHNPEKLCELCEFLVLVRDGRPANLSLPCKATILNPEEEIWINISSTELRRRIKQGQSIEGLTALPVAKFIHNKKLYQ